MKHRSLNLSLLTVITITAVGIDGHNVLFMPLNMGSHIIVHASVAEALVKSGHQASILKHRSVPIPSQFGKSGIDFVDYDTDEKNCIASIRKREWVACDFPSFPSIQWKEMNQVSMSMETWKIGKCIHCICESEVI